MCDPRLKSLLGQNTKGAFLLTWHQCGLTAKTSKNQSTSSSQAGNNSQEQSKSWQNHFTSRFISILPASGIRSLCVSLCACVSLYGFECVCVWARAWAKSLQSYPTFCNPMDSSLPGSSVHGILQARILEWVAMPFFRGSFPLKNWTRISYISYIGRQSLSLFNTNTTLEMYWMEYYSALKKNNEIMSLAATWMDPEIVLRRQRRINTYCMISLICRI